MAGVQDWRAVLNEVDVESANLIVQLQMEDALTLSNEQRSLNQTAGDANFASVLLQQELRALQIDLPNRKVGEDLEDLDNDEQEVFEAAAFGWKLKQWEGHVEHVAEPEPQPVPPPAPPPITCSSCTDDFSPANILQAPCGDHYCRGCLEYLYRQSMTDETLFPPRCCQIEIPWRLARNYLSQRCRSQFGAKQVELQTKDRTYCWVPTCSAFIKPDRIDANNNVAHCPKGSHYTCALCKNAWHFGPCPRDTTMDLINNLADEKAWQRCSVCRRILELKFGCNHMTCLCKHEFCYVCGVEWKNCTCPQWDEDRLIERAEQLVVEGRIEANIEEAANHLQQNHECTHGELRRFGGRDRTFNCELCGTTYQEWIYRCRHCLMHVCNRCRKNRF